jgi:hypothetical protein
VGRLVIAHALRLIVVLCVGLSIVFAVFTVVGLALGDVVRPGYIAATAIGAVALLLSIARLAHLMLARLVDLGPPAKSRAESRLLQR